MALVVENTVAPWFGRLRRCGDATLLVEMHSGAGLLKPMLDRKATGYSTHHAVAVAMLVIQLIQPRLAIFMLTCLHMFVSHFISPRGSDAVFDHGRTTLTFDMFQNWFLFFLFTRNLCVCLCVSAIYVSIKCNYRYNTKE